MPTKIRIYITKEVLDQSCFCLDDDLSNNCAIALAIRDIFPKGQVFLEGGDFKAQMSVIQGVCAMSEDKIDLSMEATAFIRAFDLKRPLERRQMEPMSFEIEISDNILERYFPIPEELKAILSSSPTLELVE